MSGSLLGPETLINTDASDVGLWAIFTQQTGLRTEQVFTFASHTQIQANRDYSTTEQESSGLGCGEIEILLETQKLFSGDRHSSLVWVFKTQRAQYSTDPMGTSAPRHLPYSSIL